MYHPHQSQSLSSEFKSETIPKELLEEYLELLLNGNTLNEIKLREELGLYESKINELLLYLVKKIGNLLKMQQIHSITEILTSMILELGRLENTPNQVQKIEQEQKINININIDKEIMCIFGIMEIYKEQGINFDKIIAQSGFDGEIKRKIKAFFGENSRVMIELFKLRKSILEDITKGCKTGLTIDINLLENLLYYHLIKSFNEELRKAQIKTE